MFLTEAYCFLSDHFAERGETREIITISVEAYETLRQALKNELVKLATVITKENNDSVYKDCAMAEIINLNKYIKMLEEQVIFEDDKERVNVPFYPKYAQDLFLHLLASVSGTYYVI